LGAESHLGSLRIQLMDDEELLWKAAELNSACYTNPPWNPAGPLEQLWEASPSFLQALPFMGTDEHSSAAKGYLYASRVWLASAEPIYQQLAGNPDGAVLDLATNIAKVKGRREMLLRMNYAETLDGVTGAAADLAGDVKETVDNMKRRGGDMAIGAGVAVVGLVLLFLFLR
jgi:hypothetical protein